MILKKQFNPLTVIGYLKAELLTSLLLSVAVYFLYHTQQVKQISLPFAIAAILGSALAIFIAFRNSNSYNRWWEARTLWGSIVNSSRIFSRQIIASADQALHTGKASPEKVERYKKEMLYRQIAFAHALCLHLRGEKNITTFKHLLSSEEFEQMANRENIPNALLLTQGIRIKQAIGEELLGPFDNISLEPTLAGFNNFQGACERIKYTPLLRQYHFFTKLFLQAFMLILPFSLIGEFTKMNASWLMIPLSVTISFVFAVMGKVGEVNENPFENTITDVPMSALCNTIERDVKEMLREPLLPPKAAPVNGYLY